MRVFLPEKRHGNEGKCWQDISNSRDVYGFLPGEANIDKQSSFLTLIV